MSGIVNIGNSCYLSSSIQCLINSKYFMNMIKEVSGPVVNELKSMSKNKIINPVNFKRLLAEKDKFFMNINQEDVYESLIKIIDIIHNETKIKVPLSQLNYKNNTWIDYIKLNGYSVINMVYSGQLANILECVNCGNNRNIFEIFNSIDLEIPEEEPKGINNSFIDYFKTVEIGPIDCENCKTKSLQRKTTSIIYFPHNLILNIKRFNVNGTKNNCAYNIERFISFKLKDKIIVYKLKVIIYHIGFSPNSGHYVSVLPLSDEKMLIINDEKIFETKMNTSSSYSYLLIYEFLKNF